ncbi:hypothetical protein ONZ45_g2551 [Pleurotus djamor]|nr:hypothetical protein ONZ45_g2551 [Pleurotus djamor]
MENNSPTSSSIRSSVPHPSPSRTIALQAKLFLTLLGVHSLIPICLDSRLWNIPDDTNGNSGEFDFGASPTASNTLTHCLLIPVCLHLDRRHTDRSESLSTSPQTNGATGGARDLKDTHPEKHPSSVYGDFRTLGDVTNDLEYTYSSPSAYTSIVGIGIS